MRYYHRTTRKLWQIYKGKNLSEKYAFNSRVIATQTAQGQSHPNKSEGHSHPNKSEGQSHPNKLIWESKSLQPMQLHAQSSAYK